MTASLEPTGQILGATVRGLDLSRPLTTPEIGFVLAALGRHGVLRFPDQKLTPAQQKAFTLQFGGLHQNASHRVEGVPEISILSNIVENGKNIGYLDAGMIWHRDVTHKKVPAFATVLHALKVPRRQGKAIGDTLFANTQAAYDDLPEAMKRRLKGGTAVHSSAQYNQNVRAAGSQRGSYDKMPYQHEAIAHPLVRPHPLTGKDSLYCDPGNVERLEGLGEGEGGDATAVLQFLNAHQTQEKYRYAYSWTEGDVLLWENFGTLHRATPDYGPDEHRLMQRSQAMADKVLDPEFVKQALQQAAF
jgi:taurine dioxygenase